MHSISRWLERRGPYQLLVILALPLATVESAKLVAIALLGKGHWLTGTIGLIVAYGLSIFVIERIFRIAKPKLLKVKWFDKAWRWFMSARAKAVSVFTQ